MRSLIDCPKLAAKLSSHFVPQGVDFYTRRTDCEKTSGLKFGETSSIVCVSVTMANVLLLFMSWRLGCEVGGGLFLAVCVPSTALLPVQAVDLLLS